MRTDFRIDGGATWLNLLATSGQTFGAHPIERLATATDVRQWLTLMGLVPSEPITTVHRDALVALREALRELAMAVVEQTAVPPRAEDHVRRAVENGGPLVQIRGAVHFDAACAAIAGSALLTLRGPDRHLLTECSESDCRWIFLDTSSRRRWCPAPACASRGRVRAHRAAMRASADGAQS